MYVDTARPVERPSNPSPFYVGIMEEYLDGSAPLADPVAGCCSDLCGGRARPLIVKIVKTLRATPDLHHLRRSDRHARIAGQRFICRRDHPVARIYHSWPAL